MHNQNKWHTDCWYCTADTCGWRHFSLNMDAQSLYAENALMSMKHVIWCLLFFTLFFKTTWSMWLHRLLHAPFTCITAVICRQNVMWLWGTNDVHVCFIFVVRRQLVLCLVSMGTLLLLGKVKPLTNEPTPPSTFCSAAGPEGVRVSKVTHIYNTPTCETQDTHANSSICLNKSLTFILAVNLWYENK